jgi:hypothetical protein
MLRSCIRNEEGLCCFTRKACTDRCHVLNEHLTQQCICILVLSRKNREIFVLLRKKIPGNGSRAGGPERFSGEKRQAWLARPPWILAKSFGL